MGCLIVKMSSMGDVIHTLPAITDAFRVIPDLRFDWVVEEAFSEIPTWHPAVARVIPIGLREMGKRLGSALRRGEPRQALRRVRERRYEAVIDAQGLVKSALVTLAARGPGHGYDPGSAREPLSGLFYTHRHGVPRHLHAITRTRRLFAAALGYAVPETTPDFGLGSTFTAEPLEPPTLVFFHGTTWHTKHWPLDHWQVLAGMTINAGFRVLLTAGTDDEVARGERIADGRPGIEVVPPGSLSRLAGILAGAAGYVGSDTGLSHLCGALNVPGVTIYGPSDPGLTAPIGDDHAALHAELACAPCKSRICPLDPPRDNAAPCQVAITPAMVWDALETRVRLSHV